MDEFDRFLESLGRFRELSEDDQAHYKAIWDPAEKAATVCERNIPELGWFSLKRRYWAFIALCETLDEYQLQGMNDEQAQLALTILRQRSRTYRKIEAAFEARLRRLDVAARAELPLTAQQLIKAFQFDPSKYI